MRRHSGARRTNTLTDTSRGEQGFWPSYADMMSSLALILFFLMLLSYLQNLITGNDLQNTQQALSDTRAELALTAQQVKDAQTELAGVTADLEGAKLTLAQQQEEITGYAAQISGQEETIASQTALINEQSAYISSANNELVAMRNQMQTIAVLRLSILEQIRDSIVSVMGDASKVSIGENGNIILSEGVLFDLGSSEIKTGSRTVLDQLIDVFTQFLSDDANARYVDSIVISGHTDITGTAQYNRQLSTERANSVLGYLLAGKSAALEKYASYFCAAGYGATRPVESNDTEAGRAANRRIEISIILKDETVLDIVNSYLALDLPAASPSPSPSASPSPSPSPAVRH